MVNLPWMVQRLRSSLADSSVELIAPFAHTYSSQMTSIIIARFRV